MHRNITKENSWVFLRQSNTAIMNLLVIKTQDLGFHLQTQLSIRGVMHLIYVTAKKMFESIQGLEECISIAYTFFRFLHTMTFKFNGC